MMCFAADFYTPGFHRPMNQFIIFIARQLQHPLFFMLHYSCFTVPLPIRNPSFPYLWANNNFT
jgi:hypothetical protein